MAYGIEEKVHARQLFVEEQLSYAEVAAETGVSLSQLKKWGSAGDWDNEQKAFEKDYLGLLSNLHKLRNDVVKKAMDTKHSQDIIAVTNFLKAVPIGRKQRGQVDRAGMFLEFIETLVEFLKGRDGEALKALYPHIVAFSQSMKTQ